MSKTKRIGVLTSGGDCAGLNAAIRAITARAVQGYGWEVFGIRRGTVGLMERPVDAVSLDLDLFTGNLLRVGGTFLGSVNSGDPFEYKTSNNRTIDRSDEIIDGYRSLSLDALIGIGGDGSLSILHKLARKGGINLVGIPKTIDNDVAGTENAIGYLTAVDVATDALDRLHPTAASHDRVMVLEVMGRDAGHIALSAGIAGGADAILIPEIRWDINSLANKIRSVKESEKSFGLVIVAESAGTSQEGREAPKRSNTHWSDSGIGYHVAQLIRDTTGMETRVTVLGHVQRGGAPNSRDRLFASVFGVAAVDLVAAEKFNRLVVWSGRKCSDIPLEEAVSSSHNVDPDGDLVSTARGLGIYIGN